MPTDAEPLIRARFCQEWLELVAKEDEPYRSRFAARVDGPLRERIQGTSRVAWIAASTHVDLADILQESFGALRAHDYYRRAFAASLTSPFFASAVQMGVRLLGMTPAMFVRWASKGWDAGFKNNGELVGEVFAPGRAQLVYRNLSPPFTASEAWMLSCQASTYGAYDLLGVQGVVRLDTSDKANGRVVLDLEWTERSSKKGDALPDAGDEP